MKVLLLDDKQERIQDIEEIVHDFNSELITSHSLEDSKNKLSNNDFDIVIVDLLVPEGYNRRVLSMSGGFELVRYIFDEMDNSTSISSVIVVSDNLKDVDFFDELNAYPISIIATDKYEWKNKLINSLQRICLRVNPVDIAIITAVDIEFTSIYDNTWNKIMDVGGISFFGKDFKTKKGNSISTVLFKTPDKGMVPTCLAMSCLFRHFKPKKVFMIGICAGKPKETVLGDIIIAGSTCDYSFGSVVDGKDGLEFFSEPRMYYISEKIRSVFYNYSITPDLAYCLRKNVGMQDVYNTDIKIKIGLMACGPLVVKSDEMTKQYILPHNKNYIGIDMETFAVYYSCLMNNCTEYASIKSVSDHGDSDKTHEHQKYCSKLSVELLKHYIDNEL